METFSSGRLQYGSFYDLLWYAFSLFQIVLSQMFWFMNILPGICKCMLSY